MLCGSDVVTLKSDPDLIFQTAVHVKKSRAPNRGIFRTTSGSKSGSGSESNADYDFDSDTDNDDTRPPNVLYWIRYRPKTRRFIQTEHEIHVLHGLTGGPFYQVVDGGQQNQAFGGRVQPKANIAKVCPPDVG